MDVFSCREKKSELYLELAHILLYYSQYQETKVYTLPPVLEDLHTLRWFLN